MTDSLPLALDIADVAKCTGLTSRALRFYKARGLLRPLRSASGRRFYGLAELERVHQIVILKRAGLTLAQIDRFTRGGPVTLARIVAAQLATLSAQAEEIAAARALLLSVQSRIDRSEPIDVVTFCSLIRQGDTLVNHDYWDKVSGSFFTPQEKAAFAETMQHMPAEYDPAVYAASWADLGRRIKAALPLAPDSAPAQAFLTEWNALLAPFRAVATPQMAAGVQEMYERMDEWQGQAEGQADPGFDAEVFRFIQAAQTHRKSAS